ncbi:MAG: hypothetical protein CMJ80_17135 [Planctomycetaceae bacterium]|nr:hypothetical protein [Planctomycetaceae bacterium]
MTTSIFAELQESLDESGPEAALQQLAQFFESEQRYHELFEVMKMQARRRLNLPMMPSESDDEFPKGVREQLEQALLDACRQVGTELLRSGQLRDAWHYLRAVGDTPLVLRELAQVSPNEENLDQFLELCIHEGLDLERGFQALLQHYGTCNTITTFDSAMYGRPRAQRAIGAQLLVAHVYDELLQNVRSHIERHEGTTPSADQTLADLIQNRDWLFNDGTYHIDTTHLSSVVNFARDLDSEKQLRQAMQLATYGQQLDENLQYEGEEPFCPLYETSQRYFRTLLDEDRESQLAFFRGRAEATNPREDTTLAIETYVDLLARVGEHRLAIQESLRLLPDDVQQTGRAPSLMELARACHDYQAVIEVSRRRNDPLAYAMCILSADNNETD